MAAATAKRGLASLGTATGVAVALWELRRKQVLSRYEEMKRRYVETGSETRFPFYGRDFGYEVDYMLELQLQAGGPLLSDLFNRGLTFDTCRSSHVAEESSGLYCWWGGCDWGDQWPKVL